MPLNGGDEYLAAAMDDVRAQPRRDWELIAVDECSPMLSTS